MGGLLGRLRRGDTLVAVDGRGVRGLPLEKVLARLAGSPGSVMALTLLRRVEFGDDGQVGFEVGAVSGARESESKDSVAGVLLAQQQQEQRQRQEVGGLGWLGGEQQEQEEDVTMRAVSIGPEALMQLMQQSNDTAEL